ncbi:hypothetical protein GQ600_27542 [Phytophthora cactorum]|nr:hypothetical protein GQ600_27542 [Phytophthora cactorum]
MKGNGDASTSLIIAALSENGVPGEMAGVEKAWMAVEKAHGLSNLHTYLKPGKKKKDGVPGRDFFVGEEELMKYLDRVDLGTFESYSSASMSLMLRIAIWLRDATRKPPGSNPGDSDAATKPSKRPKQA